MIDWIKVVKKPVNYGNSRGFRIKKKEMRLKANKEYVIMIIPKENYYKKHGLKQ